MLYKCNVNSRQIAGEQQQIQQQIQIHFSWVSYANTNTQIHLQILCVINLTGVGHKARATSADANKDTNTGSVIDKVSETNFGLKFNLQKLLILQF